MDLQLKSKRALVTGSTAGIGFAIAACLAREGARVIVNGRTEEGVGKAVASLKTETGGVVKSARSEARDGHPQKRGVRRSQPGDDGELLDLSVLVRPQEGVVVFHRDAAVRIAVGPEHIGMGEQSGPAVEPAIADRI